MLKRTKYYIEAIKDILYELDLATLEALFEVLSDIVERRKPDELLPKNNRKAQRAQR